MKKILKAFALAFFLLICFSCERKECGCGNFQEYIEFNVKLNDGTFLFDNADYDIREVEFYYSENGEWKNARNGNSPELREIENHQYMFLLLTNPGKQPRRLYKLKLNDEFTDEFTVDLSYTENSSYVVNLWYNGVKIENFQPRFTIQK